MRAGRELGGRIANARGPTGRELGFSGPDGRARVRKTLGRAVSADPAVAGSSLRPGLPSEEGAAGIWGPRAEVPG